MPRHSQTQMLQQMKEATDPVQRHDLALALLAVSLSREMVDEALRVLAAGDLRDDDRPTLREKALYYFEHDDKDSGALLRENLIRLLTRTGDPADGDLYLMGVNVYEPKPVIDVAQTCRAAALVGLAGVDRALACVHAVRLLGEPDTSQLSGEPSLTAINVLARFNEPLPIYHFLLRQGEDYARRGLGEVVARGFEMLGRDFPPEAFSTLAEPLLALDSPPVTAGVINYIVEGRAVALYPLLGRILDETRDDDLYHYGLLAMAAARDDGLAEMLFARAKACSQGDVRTYIEAVELTAHPDREDVLAMLEKRV